MPTLLKINISRGGVPKRPVPEAEVTPLGITGDVQAHPQVHGGLRQALLLITSEGIDDLISQGFSLFHGALGENLTTQGIDRRLLRIGQRYRIGNVVIEITKVRAPCDQLNVYGPGIQKAVYDVQVKDGDSSSARWGLSGFYASVVQPGPIFTGAPILLLDQFA